MFHNAAGRPELMGGIVANQAAGIRRTVVGNGSPAVGSDDPDIKIHQAFARNGARLCAHTVARMADRAGESVLLNVAGVFAETGVIHNLRKVVALGTQRVGAATGAALGVEARIGEQIRNRLARNRRLTELIPAFQNVRKN